MFFTLQIILLPCLLHTVLCDICAHFGIPNIINRRTMVVGNSCIQIVKNTKNYTEAIKECRDQQFVSGELAYFEQLQLNQLDMTYYWIGTTLSTCRVLYQKAILDNHPCQHPHYFVCQYNHIEGMVDCAPLTNPAVWLKSYSNNVLINNKYHHGINATFICPSTNANVNSICNNGIWSVPTENLEECPTACKPLIIPEYWFLNYSTNMDINEEYPHGTNATSFCLSTKKTIISNCKYTRWSVVSGHPSKCPTVDCDEINADAYWTLVYDQKETAKKKMPNGTFANLTCQSTPDISTIVNCSNGTWSSTIENSCQPVKCQPLSMTGSWMVEYDGVKYNDSWMFNTTATVSCPGDSFRQTIIRTCQYFTGKWSGEAPDKPCPSVPCEKHKAEDFWLVNYDNEITDSKTYNHSTHATFMCRSTNTSIESICDDGNWTVLIESLPKCLAAACPSLTTQFFWFLNYTTDKNADDDYTHGTEASFFCLVTNKLVTSACYNSQWSITIENLETCPPANCEPVMNPLYWKLSYNANSTNSQNKHGTTATFYCLHSNEEILSVCSNGKWNMNSEDLLECPPACGPPSLTPYGKVSFYSELANNISYSIGTMATLACNNPRIGMQRTKCLADSTWLPKPKALCKPPLTKTTFYIEYHQKNKRANGSLDLLMDLKEGNTKNFGICARECVHKPGCTAYGWSSDKKHCELYQTMVKDMTLAEETGYKVAERSDIEDLL